MVLYDSNYKIIGVSKSVLDILDFDSPKDFYLNFVDVDDLFLDKKDKYFVDVILNDPTNTPNGITIKLINGSLANIHINTVPFCLRNSEENIYQISITPAVVRDGIDDYSLMNSFQTQHSINSKKPELRVPNLSVGYTKNIVKLEQEPSIEEKIPETSIVLGPNKQWFDEISSHLDMSEDDLKIILSELVIDLRQSGELFYESILLGNIANSTEILERLRDSAMTLNLSSLTEILDKFSNPKYETSQTYKEYNDFIGQIERLIA